MSEKVKVYEIGIDELLPDPTNANKGSLRGQKMIDDSIAKTGLHRGVAVDANGYVVAGNKTQQAAIDAGFKKALVVETDGDTLVVTKRRDFNLLSDDPNNIARQAAYYDNRSSEVSLTWDAEVLLADLQSGVDLSGMFNQDELDALLDGLVEKEPVQDAGAQIDKAAELQAKWNTQAGQLWQLGRHRLICGDCTDKATVERLMQGERAKTLFFDPEWNDNVQRIDGFDMVLAFGDGATIGKMFALYGAPTWLFVWDCVSCWYTPNRPLRRVKLCAWYGDITKYNFDGWHYGDAGEERTVWNTRGEYTFKPDPRGKHLADLYQNPITQLHAESEHSHSKPLDWITMLVANCATGDVFDPYAGSGTTLIACEQLNRQCRAVEISPAYCGVILQRFFDSTGQTPVLIDSFTVDKQ